MPMKRDYNGSSMVKAGHFSKLYPRLTGAEQKSVTARIEELISENPAYCDAGNYEHLSSIFSAIAIYEVLQRHGKSKAESLETVSQALWDYAESETAPTYRRVFALPGMLKVMGRLLPGMFARGSGCGWSYVWHTDTATGKYLQFECTSCIYAQLFAEYGAAELGPAFCQCDEINYGQIPGLSFKRRHTLCRDGQPCDFLFVKKKGGRT